MAWKYPKNGKGESNSQGHRFGAEIDPAFRFGMRKRIAADKPEPDPQANKIDAAQTPQVDTTERKHGTEG